MSGFDLATAVDWADIRWDWHDSPGNNHNLWVTGQMLAECFPVLHFWSAQPRGARVTECPLVTTGPTSTARLPASRTLC
jgi:hypothetical protein